MKVLVTYVSWTGNTKKVAGAIFQEIQAKKEMKELDEVGDITGYDLVFVGFPIHGFGQVAAKAMRFLDNCCAGKKTALFATHATPEDSPVVRKFLKNCRAAAAKARLLGIFNCQGQIAQDLLDWVLQSSDSETRERVKGLAVVSKGQPDEARLERARAFVKEMMKKAG